MPSTTLSRSRFRALRATLAGLGAVALLSTAACGSSGTSAGSGGDGAAKPINRLEIMAPADPGGGWDQTARAMSSAIEADKLAKSVQVSNVGGAGGTVGLAELKNERSEDFLMVMGLVMVGAVETNKSQATLADTTPLARLTSEDEVIVVPAESPYKTIDDLVAAMKSEGRGVSIAGGSAGGTDNILAGLLAKEAGVPATDLNYIAYSGGGESLAALLGNQVSAGISGAGEYAKQVEAGTVRALAVSGAERIEGLDAPTLKESGYDIEFTNWRGVVAPPGISEEAEAKLEKLVDDMHSSKAWTDLVAKNGWTDDYLSGDEFETFLGSEQERISGVLKDIGLTQ
ncbi:putative tricarboxylic transport membrane protein [Quadrisphaera granulorum]|uniref:Putative tricarboxylic transport membrane protein n=1 Tax=Quadrisphaera granulorum TaxID=317664 RepID=A0A316ACB4_9ACTN|nr:tripartite tricarboxylate transporter substrate-binding protein [Quadrisphaera granulorum]PWJ55375.1 putative tricarboxylic transport membrane protein [Quadrisphaera granulorum]SZE95439.1 putative tricarboxylic transport membrane protein [Quadrisphaera granulorum]